MKLLKTLPIKLEGGERFKAGLKKPLPGMPLISVITATFNASEFLPRTVSSLREQTYPNFEWIVIDGGSIDGTVDILRQNEGVIDYWVSEPDKGVYDAWNKAIDLCNGEWISFLGSGDTYHSDALHKYVEYIENNHNKLEYVSSRVEYQYNNGTSSRIIGKPWQWKVFHKYMCVAHVGSLHNKSLFNKYGLFDISYKISGDYELLLRPKLDLCAGFLPEITTVMMSGGVSVTGSNALKETYRAKVNTAGKNKLMSTIEFCVAYFKQVIKRFLRRM